MALHHVVLALLADGPSHGYELKGAFEEAVGPQWGAMNIGHLYQLLDRLERDGLAAPHREPQTTRPDRVVFELTDAGRGELENWLTAPAPRSGGYRDDFFLKVVAAHRSGDREILTRVLDSQRSHLLSESRTLAELASDHTSDPVVSLLIANARLHVDADLRLVTTAEETLGPLAPGTARTTQRSAADQETHPSEPGRASRSA